jgi:hypothetical protein
LTSTVIELDVLFAALLALRGEAANFEGEDEQSHQDGNQGDQILQARSPECREVHSEGLPSLPGLCQSSHDLCVLLVQNGVQGSRIVCYRQYCEAVEAPIWS